MKNKISFRKYHPISFGILFFCLGAPIQARAEDMPISDMPLFLSSAVTPNVFFEVDDSGSMDWSILTKKHWHFCAYDPTYETEENLEDEDCGYLVTNGLWTGYSNVSGGDILSQSYRYIFTSSDNAYSTSCSSGNNASLDSCSTDLAYQLDWRIRSSDLNVVYFDPNADYEPWNGPCFSIGTNCTNADFSAARSNPREGESGYTITRDLDGFIYEVWTDDKGYSDERPHRGDNTNANSTPNGEVDLWDTHTRYTIVGDTIEVSRVTYTPGSPSNEDPSGLDAHATNTTLSGTDCFSELYPGDPEQCRTIDEVKQHIANWFQYHRRRAFVTKDAIAAVVSDNTSYRYGLSVLNNYNDLFVQTPAATTTNYIPHNRDMLAQLFNLNWSNDGTPLRKGLERVGKYYDNELGNNFDDPIIGSCQKNFTILFTDGYWNGGNPSVNNEDGDPYTKTLADVAKYYYDNDLSSKANEVPVDDFDTQNQQHMVTFTVAFGVEGDLVDTDDPPNGWPDDGSGNDLDVDSDWGNPNNNSAKIDDLWHAAYNSRGTYVAASTASEVVGALAKALLNVEKRTASAASVALNTGLAGSNSSLYMARFDSREWTGELNAIAIDSETGEPDTGPPTWEASKEIPGWNSRTILTHTGNGTTGNGAAFRWAELSTTQKDFLRAGFSGTTAEIDAAAQERLSFLRGDDANEERNDGLFRDRPTSVLGDIINSSPTYVGYPIFPYSDDLEQTSSANNYIAFRKKYGKDGSDERVPMLYVGANDGMLHGFDANTGEEKLAFIPNAVFSNLSQLAQSDYGHRFFVDGTPTMGDAFIDPRTANGNNKSWHTVLVGGLNKGGQGIYALDVTDPDTFDEDTTSTVLWELTDADDPDLGDTYSRPAIVRMANGRWAAVFGNGYNNTRNDGNASTSGNAMIFIVDLGTGDIIRKISTQTGPDEDPEAYMDNQGQTVYRHRANGLATTAPVDVDGDHIIDYIYAGDLFGNLWKFDVRDKDEDNWDVAFHNNTGDPIPLFIACEDTCVSGLNSNHQPITTRPEVGRSPDRYGLMVYFGTGKYLASQDITDHRTQSFYGIIDNGSGPYTSSRDALLAEQTIDDEVTASFYDTDGNETGKAKVRLTSDNGIGTMSGWYMDLISPIDGSQGERMVQTPVLRNGRIIFATTIPTNDTCGFGGSSWLMELDAYEGQRLTTSPFDLNEDGKFDGLDNVTKNSDGDTINLPASGKGQVENQ
jgi:type IV pilus assembly protein PilY1